MGMLGEFEQQGYEGSPVDSSLETPETIVTGNPQSSTLRDRFAPIKLNRTAVLLTAVITLFTLLLGVGGVLATNLLSGSNKQTANSQAQNADNSYAVGSIPLNGLKSSSKLEVSNTNSTLAVNGQLQVNSTLVLAATKAPTNPVAGEIYFDQATNQPYFYNGSGFVPLNAPTIPEHVTSLGGAGGVLSVGTGLQLASNTLSVNSQLLQQVSTAANATKVVSIQGQSGNVTFSAGAGIAINGTTVTNSGVVSLSSGPSGSLAVGSDGNGNYTVDFSGGGVVTLGPDTVQNDTSDNSTIHINKTGAGNLIDLSTNNHPLLSLDQTGILSVTGSSAAVKVGESHTLDGRVIFTNQVNDYTTSLQATGQGNQSRNQVINIPLTTSANGTDNICLQTLANCTSGNVSTSVATAQGYVPLFSSDTDLGKSSIQEDNSGVTVGKTLSVTTGDFKVTAANGGIYTSTLTSSGDLTVGAATSHILTLQGNASSLIKVTSGTFATILEFATPDGTNAADHLNNHIQFPNQSGTVCLVGANCGFATAGSGVASLQGAVAGSVSLYGSVTINNALTSTVGSNNYVTIQDAKADYTGTGTGTKGIATFTAANFTDASGVIDTIQGISKTATPEFAALTVTGGSSGITFKSNATTTYGSISNDGANPGYLKVSGNSNIIFYNQNGSNSFLFPTDGGLGQTICTTGVTCAAGNGLAVILGQNSGGSNPVAQAQTNTGRFVGININQDNSGGTANLAELQTNGLDAFVVDHSGTTTVKSLATNSITPTAHLYAGATTQSFTLQGDQNSTIEATDSAHNNYKTSLGFGVTIDPATGLPFAAPLGNVTYTFENDSNVAPGSYTVCTSAGNCSGVSGGLNGTGNSGQVAVFSSQGSVSSSALLSASTTNHIVTIGGNLAVGDGSTANGNLIFKNTTNANNVTLQLGGVPANNVVLTIPTPTKAGGFSGTFAVSASGPIGLDSDGTISCATCLTGSSGPGNGANAVTSIQGAVNGSAKLTGDIIINNASTSTVGSTNYITIQDAKADYTGTGTGTKGIAAFTQANFSASNGVIDTIQGIGKTASPQFAAQLLGDDTAVNGQLSFADGTGDSGQKYRQVFKLYQALSANQLIYVPNNSGTLAVAVASAGNLSLSNAGVLDITATPTFTGVTTSTLTLKNGGSTTVGIKLDPTQSTSGITVSLPVLTANDTICVLSAGCGGSGIGTNVTGNGNANYVTKFYNGDGSKITTSQLYDDGNIHFVGINTTTNTAQLAVVTGGDQSGLYVLGSAATNSTYPVAVVKRATATATGDLLQFQNNGGSVLTNFDKDGSLLFNGTGNTVKTTAGNLSLQAFTGLNLYVNNGSTAGAKLDSSGNLSFLQSSSIGAADVTAASGTGYGITVKGGNETGTTSTGGSVSIDAGTGTTANGNLDLGKTNAKTITIGNNASTALLQGNSVSLKQISGANSTTVNFTGSQSGNLIYQFDNTTTAGTYQICTTALNCLGSSSSAGGANNALSNLNNVAINTSLLPGNNAVNLGGSGTSQFKDAYLSGQLNVGTIDTTGGLSIGTSTATSISLGSAAKTTSFAVTTSGGSFAANATSASLSTSTAQISVTTSSGPTVSKFYLYETSGSSIQGLNGVLSLQGTDATIKKTSGSYSTTVGFSGAVTTNATYNFDSTANGTYTVCSTAGNCNGTGTSSGGANNALSNLYNTAINADLKPQTDNSINLGGSSLRFVNGYFLGTLTAGSIDNSSLGVGSATAATINIGNSTNTTGVTVYSKNSTSAFTVQNASAVPVFNVDTTNQTVTLQSKTDSLPLGGDLYPTNNFSSGWTNSGWTFSPTTQATHTTGNTSALQNNNITITASTTYLVTFTVGGTCGTGNVVMTMGGVTVATLDATNFCGGNQFSRVITTTSTAKPAFTPDSTWTGTISGLSIKPVSSTYAAALTVKNSSGVANLEVRTSSTNSNLFVGATSGQYNISGIANSAFGSGALTSNTSGSFNTALGNFALFGNTNGVENTAVGQNALLNNTTGNLNSALGYNALSSNTTGSANSAVGPYALQSNTTGSTNTAVGISSLQNNTTGTGNVALGASASLNNTTGKYNTGVGTSALTTITTGSYNSALGYSAAYQDSLGYFSTASNIQYSTAIGAYAQVQASNSIVLGSVDTATKVGIGTTVPQNTFSVSPVHINGVIGCSTATASGTTCSGTSTTFIYASSGSFTTNMVGEQIIFADGSTATISTFTSSTNVTLSSTVNEASGSRFRVQYTGLQVKNDGTTYVQGTSSTQLQVKNAAGTNVVTVDTSGTGSLVVQSSASTNALRVTNGTPSATTENPAQTALGGGATNAVDYTGWDFTFGFEFKPTATGFITALGAQNVSGGDYYVTIYKTDGSMVAQTQISTTGSGTWNYSTITPVALTGGTYYYAVLDTSDYATCSNSTITLGQVTPNIYIASTNYGYNGFGTLPDQDNAGILCGMPDFTYTVSSPDALQVDTVNNRFIVGSSATIHTNTNSTNGLVVQNSVSGNVLRVDTVNNTVNLFEGYGGTLGSWTTNSSSVPNNGFPISTTYNGYAYAVTTNTVYYAKINPGGGIGTWNIASSAPPGNFLSSGALTTYNGYVYAYGTGGTYIARLNLNGTISSWRFDSSVFVPTSFNNGYAYGPVNGQSITYAKVNADGTFGTQNTLVFPPGCASNCGYGGITFANGYAYIIGGFNSNGAGTVLNSTFYSAVNSDGTFSGWVTGPNLPYAWYPGQPAVQNGYIYLLGDYSSTTAGYRGSTIVMVSKLSANGGLGGWSVVSNLPAARGGGVAFSNNGYLYFLGGNDASGFATYNIYYASGARLQVGGDLDLVGLQGEAAADGPGNYAGTQGGSITAGNVTAYGNLQAYGNTYLKQDVSVGGSLRADGGLVVKNSVDTSSIGTEFIGAQSYGSNPPWTSTGWTTTSNTATHTIGNTNAFQYAYNPPAVGKRYLVSFTVASMANGSSLTMTYGGVSSSIYASGVYAFPVTATSTSNLTFTPSANFNGTLSGISLKQYTATPTATLSLLDSTGATALEVRAASNNSFIGLGAGSLNQSGTSNTGVGSGAIASNTSGSGNTSLGYNSLNINNAGAYNTAVGVSALGQNTTGVYNTAIGYNAGTSDGGYVQQGNLTYATAIGAGAVVQASNSIVLGRSSSTTNVGIGTTVPLNVLSVNPVMSTGFTACSTTSTSGTTCSNNFQYYLYSASAIFNSSMIGGEIVFSDGQATQVNTINSSNNITVYPAINEPSGATFRVHYPGLQVDSSGRVGVGVLSPGYQLDVSGSNSTGYVARIQNTSASTATGNPSLSADGLLIDLGTINASRTTGNYFIGFSGGGTVAGKIQGGASAVAYTTSGADYAEYFHADQNNLPTAGELVTLDQTAANSVVKSTAGSTAALAGIVSTNPGFIGNGPICNVSDTDCDKNYAAYNALVALSGQVPAKVNSSNGPIAVGDPITVSAIPGEGAKATADGYIVGYAMEALSGDQGTIQVLVRPGYVSVKSNDIQGQSLNVVGNSILNGGLQVGGDVNIGGVTLTHDLTVRGSATIATLVVTGSTTVDDITIGGHIITAGSAPTVAPLAAAGTAGSTVTIDGNDTAGTITVVIGADASDGDLARITFNKVFDRAPRVSLTPVGAAAARLQAYVSDTQTAGFSLGGANAPVAGTTYTFNYQVLQ